MAPTPLAFAEAFRVLKPGRYMAVVFGNSDGQVWGLVQRAIRDAGFRSVPVHVPILDKGQRSVKGLNSGYQRGRGLTQPGGEP